MADETDAPAKAAGASEDLRPAALPDGEYAIVEVLGHRTLVGRVAEAERFGARLLSVEPLFAGELLPAVLIGGGSIYQFTPCSREVAAARAPRQRYQLPASVAATLPAPALAAPAERETGEADWADEDGVGGALSIGADGEELDLDEEAF